MNKVIAFLLALVTIFWVSSCLPGDQVNTDPGVSLSFSLDTIRFDTVFTEVGSSTQILKVYNSYDQPLNISDIQFKNGNSTKFRMNVDGIAASRHQDVFIPAEDSIYVFVEVTIDPDEPLSSSPFVISDAIQFEINSNEQEVILEAWGQNANYIPSRFGSGGVALLSCNNEEVLWDDPKPYVIYGVLVVDSCSLRMIEGTQVYVHGGVAIGEDGQGGNFIYNDGLLVVGANGRLITEGTPENPVVIQGDRLEEFFEEITGQWSGIRISGEDSYLLNTEIKNSKLGIYVDSSASLELDKVKVYNTTGPGLYAKHADIQASNTLFYNNGGGSVQLVQGGNYDFTYCTLASYGYDASALTVSNGICYDPLCSTFDINPLNIKVTNSIVFGSRRDEINMVDFTSGQGQFVFNVELEDCIVRVDDLLDPEEGGYPNFFEEYCNPCLNGDPSMVLFANPSENDFHLDTLSVAEQLAVPIPGITTDLENNDRDPQNPDLGCYEYIYE